MQLVTAKHRNLARYLPLLLIILGVAFIRFRLLDVPLERDEGEYAYMAQLLLDGIPPYQAAYNMKFPGIYFLYGLIILFLGQTHTAIHWGLLLANALSVLFMYFIGKSVHDRWVGLLAAGTFGILSLSYHVQGLWANAEHFVLPFVLGGFLVLRYALVKKNLLCFLLSGFLFGIGTLVKQHGAFFGFMSVLYFAFTAYQNGVFFDRRTLRDMSLFIAGALLPMIGTFLYLFHAGVFNRFFFWAFIYSRAYTSQIPFDQASALLLKNFLPLLKATLPLWAFAAIGFLSLFFAPFFKQLRLFMVCFIVGGLLATSPGFIFRPHYFVLLLPAASLSAALGFRFLYYIFGLARNALIRIAPPTITVVSAFIGCVGSHLDIFFQFSPVEVTRAAYGANPFPESLAIGQFIKSRTSHDEKIAIIGNEPQILFYSQRRSATGYIYIYPLIENHPYAFQMQEEMIQEIEFAQPKLLLYTQILPSWYSKFPAEEKLLQWFSAYVSDHDTLIARLEYEPSAQVREFLTDPSSLQAPPKRTFWISIYERKHAPSTEIVR